MKTRTRVPPCLLSCIFAACALGTTERADFAPLNPSFGELGRAVVAEYVRALGRRAESAAGSEDGVTASALLSPDGAVARSSAPWTAHVHALLRARQELPAAECRTSRLLLVQFPDDSYEGLGSVLSLLTLGLAEAVYSNRTLIWGADLTPLLELSRPAWQQQQQQQGDPHGGRLGTTLDGGVHLDCSGSALGGGSFGCLFQPLSHCSLADATSDELTALARHGFDDAGRLKLMDHRRSVVAYHAPPGLWEWEGGGGGSSSGPAAPDHVWAAALASYVFRLQPAVRSAFERTAARLDGGAWAPDTACAQVRHGDILSMPSVYQNREAYPFSAYFDALLQPAASAAHQLQGHHRQAREGAPASADPPLATRPQAKPPSALFVASDSPYIAEAVEQEREAARRAGRYSPRFLTVPASQGRLLTDYGSHTVAAGHGVCSRTKCGLPYTVLDYYAKHSDADGPSRPARLLRVMYDAAEDLFLLSRCARLATTASSRYGVIAALLSWAASDGANAPATVFLDADPIASGELQNGWLHWSYNGTNRSAPHVRWSNLTRLFVEGLMAPPPVDAGLAIRDLLPHMPGDLLWPEVLRWGSGAGAVPGGAVWPGECPHARAAVDSDADAVVRLINGGVDHMMLEHVGQALTCWR